MPWTALITPLLSAGATLSALIWMAVSLRRARIIEDTPTSKIRSAAQGYVELIGFAQAHADGPLLAPLSKTPCVWYSYRIERLEQHSGRQRWRTVEKGRSDQPFVLRDETGHCLVEPDRATITATTQRWEHDSGDPPPAFFLVPGKPGLHRYVESRIHQDDWLYAIGWFTSRHAESAEKQTKVLHKQLLSEWKSDQASLLARFDHNRDGHIDGPEWERARSTAEREAARLAVTTYDATPQHILRCPPQRRYPFIIASQDPKLLTRRYQRQAALALAVAVLAAAVFSALVLTH